MGAVVLSALLGIPAHGGSPISAWAFYFAATGPDGEPVINICAVDWVHTYPTAATLDLSAIYDGGSVSLKTVDVEGDETTVEFDSTEIPNGLATLLAHLYDLEDNLLACAAVEIMVLNPTLDFPPPQGAGEGPLVGIDLAGCPGDSFYLLLVSGHLEDSYHASYGLTLPLPESGTLILTAGVFQDHYGGGIVSFTMPIGNGEPFTLYAMVLTWNEERGWQRSAVKVLER